MVQVQIVAQIAEPGLREIVMALLIEEGYDGFEENDEQLIAYIANDKFVEQDLRNIFVQFELSYTVTNIPEQNWNKLWEDNFQPVIVGDFCTVKADFHDLKHTTVHEIIINPKMSFGTGHHATTQLMIQQMKGMDFASKSVLDFGTGTGILAILSEKLGATEILAIDNEDWSFANGVENVSRNNCLHIVVKKGSLETVSDQRFDIVLSNINRHILLQYMNQMYSILNINGVLLLSGILVEDREIILQSAQDSGLKFVSEQILNNWMAMQFVRE